MYRCQSEDQPKLETKISDNIKEVQKFKYLGNVLKRGQKMRYQIPLAFLNSER